jgi:hypothetical protein
MKRTREETTNQMVDVSDDETEESKAGGWASGDEEHPLLIKPKLKKYKIEQLYHIKKQKYSWTRPKNVPSYIY